MRTLPGPGRLEALSYAADPYGAQERWRARHGALFWVPLPTGPLVVVARPDGVSEVLRADPGRFDVWMGHALRPVFGDSIFTTHGAAHLRHRRAVLAALQRLPPAEPWVRAALQDLPARVELGELGLAVARKVALGTLLGSWEPELEALLVDYSRMSASPAVIAALALPALRGAHWPWWGRFARLRARLHARLPPPQSPVLHTLAERLTPEELQGEIVTLLLASYETTARSISWMLSDLLDRPAVLHRLRAEPDAPLLRSAALEALRHRTVVLQAQRVTRDPFVLLGHPLPAGTTLSLAAHLLHHDPALYERPHDFVPERFLAQGPDPSTFLAFGGGARRCPGASLALSELRLVLQHLLQHYELVPLTDAPRGRLQGMVLAPGPRWVELRARTSARPVAPPR
jgi:cytochrome P450